MKVALFDFDGTLYPHETFETLRLHLRSHPKYKKNYKHFVRYFAPTYFGYKLKLVPKIKMQQRALESYILSFKGYSKTDIEEFFTDVARSMSEELRRPLLDKIKQLKQDNYYVVLISGAFIPLLEALFKGIGFDLIVGSSVNYNNKGKLDYKARFERVFAERKIDIIKEHFKNKEIDWSNSRAYSDSISDLKMLELVGKPVAVSPDSDLLSVAQKNNWKILNNI
ncbi:HAD-IB family hydrolase [Jeotgalicoccus huakuii]|nr:HAD-IB family hydrolase [Jeotgalicoccus huakuii]